jgi:dihydrodipicolinate synthase/N-acetylneuraminate lyase
MFDGTLSGFWNFAKEPMLEHLAAWDRRDLDAACKVWEGGLSELQDYIADMGRLHIRYKTATWLRGLIPNPFMRPPMPKPMQSEIDTIYRLLKQLNLSVIDEKDTKIEL